MVFYCLEQARISDTDRLCELERISFDPAIYAADILSRRHFSHLLRAPSAEIPVLRSRSGAISGSAVILYRKGSTLARLYSLAVDPAMRGGGLGKLLIACAADRALTRGKNRIRLEVRAGNQDLIRLYESCGFQACGRLKDYYGRDIDALRMEKKLR